jgi:Flp pilus assembly protein CpaB
VAAAVDISEGDIIGETAIMQKAVPVSARPEQAIAWARSTSLVGQKALRSVVQGDYVLLSDVGFARTMAGIVGQGEWAVSMRLPSGGIARILQPGDQVAIVGTFQIRTKVKTADLSQAPADMEKEATLVLFPRVTVLDVGGVSLGGSGEASAQEIIVSLPPRQAQVLVAAQRKASLTLALRRPMDESATSRVDAGMVDEETFDKLLKGLESVSMPAAPGLPDGAPDKSKDKKAEKSDKVENPEKPGKTGN